MNRSLEIFVAAAVVFFLARFALAWSRDKKAAHEQRERQRMAQGLAAKKGGPR